MRPRFVLGPGLVLWLDGRLGRVLGLAMRVSVYIGGNRLSLREENYVCLGRNVAPVVKVPPKCKDQDDENGDWSDGVGRAQGSVQAHQSGREGYYYCLLWPLPQFVQHLDTTRGFGNLKRGESKKADEKGMSDHNVLVA